MRCPSCGAENPSDSTTCRACGAPLGARGERMDVTPETKTAYELQSAWQTGSAPSASYESLGDVEDASAASVPAGDARKGRGWLAGIIAAVVLAVLVGFVWGSGLFGGGASESPSEAGSAEDTAAQQANSLGFSISVPGLDADGSRIPIQITGTTATGEEYSHLFYLSMAGEVSEPIELEDGVYSVVVAGSPISSTGIVYNFDNAYDEVTLDAANDVQARSVTLDLEPIEALFVTDEQIEAAYQWAAADDACENADALRQAAYSRRTQALQ